MEEHGQEPGRAVERVEEEGEPRGPSREVMAAEDRRGGPRLSRGDVGRAERLARDRAIARVRRLARVELELAALEGVDEVERAVDVGAPHGDGEERRGDEHREEEAPLARLAHQSGSRCSKGFSRTLRNVRERTAACAPSIRR